MNATFREHTHPIIRKLESIFRLSDDEKAAVMDLPLQITAIKADQDIVREGDRPSRCFAVLDGFACTFKITGEGKRQISSFHIPGDLPDLQSLHLTVLDISIGTITPCSIGFVQHEAARDLCARFPRIGSAFWRETLIQAAIFREWVTNVGRREAYGRVAHLLCEMAVRMRAVGLADANTCDLPMTQNELADATGMSTVHVNRTLQELRADGLITLKGASLTVLDWNGLKHAGDFDPTYLHFERKDVAA